VLNGMTRFVGLNPQYAMGLKQGGMIGYVMDSQSAKVIDAVDKQIKKNYKDLRMKSSTGLSPSFKLSSILPNISIRTYALKFTETYRDGV